MPPPLPGKTNNSIQALRAEADGRALILLDELGTGTDPVEGAALGVALLRRLVKGGVGGGALTVATTHHSLMTKLKFEDPRCGSGDDDLGRRGGWRPASERKAWSSTLMRGKWMHLPPLPLTATYTHK